MTRHDRHLQHRTPGQAPHPRGYGHFLGTGIGSGLVAGICCVGSAMAADGGLGGLPTRTAGGGSLKRGRP